MKLYFAPPMASLTILITAYETDQEIELVEMDLTSRQLPDGRNLSEVSAKGSIPVLEREDGSILTETPVMLDWLAAQDCRLRLTAPLHSEEHVRICEWMAYFASEQHRLFSLLFWDIDQQARKIVRERIVDRFAIAESALEDVDYLVGNRCTIADIYLMMMARGAHHLIKDFRARTRFPRIHDLVARIEARPTVQRAMRDHKVSAS